MTNSQIITLLILTVMLYGFSYLLLRMVSDMFLMHYKSLIATNAAKYCVSIAGSFFVVSQAVVLGWKMYLVVIILSIIIGITLMAISGMKRLFLHLIAVGIGLGVSLLYALIFYLSAG